MKSLHEENSFFKECHKEQQLFCKGKPIKSMKFPTTSEAREYVGNGKAVYGMMKAMSENPTKWEGRKVLFIHTGGLLGLYDKAEQMAPLVGNWRKMDIHESIPREDGTGKMF